MISSSSEFVVGVSDETVELIESVLGVLLLACCSMA